MLPVIAEEEDKTGLMQALSLETIEAELLESEPYTVDVPCIIDGEVFNKRFMFYTVDREKHFYLLLNSDVTDVLREQRERNELLANALQEVTVPLSEQLRGNRELCGKRIVCSRQQFHITVFLPSIILPV